MSRSSAVVYYCQGLIYLRMNISSNKTFGSNRYSIAADFLVVVRSSVWMMCTLMVPGTGIFE